VPLGNFVDLESLNELKFLLVEFSEDIELAERALITGDSTIAAVPHDSL
jgi:hypothetical protein